MVWKLDGGSMQYPLTETIGNPDLFVGRHEEFERLNEWLEFIPERLSMSTVILARKKKAVKPQF